MTLDGSWISEIKDCTQFWSTFKNCNSKNKIVTEGCKINKDSKTLHGMYSRNIESQCIDYKTD